MEVKGRLITITFFSTVSASSNKTLVSKFIDVPFKVKQIAASFAPGVNRLMTLKFFTSQDAEAPTTAEPNGTNLLSQHGQVAYITGDDERKVMSHEVEYKNANGYIKIYAENSDVFQHTIDCQVTLELLPRQTEEK